MKCLRCHREAGPIKELQYKGPLRERIEQNTCDDCWKEWSKFQVMVINDFKLKVFLPHDRAVLEQHMREFLSLS